MEVSVIGSSSQAKICGRKELVYRGLRFFVAKNDNNGSKSFCPKPSCVYLEQSTRGWRTSSGLRFTLNAVQSTEPLRQNRFSRSKPKTPDDVRIFVGLPLDAVTNCNTIKHARAIAVGLKALKLLGLEGVELPVWWGIVEKEERGKYDWSSYLALAEMVKIAGLKLHVSLCFHASQQAKIPLPEWVSRIGESQPGIFFSDRSGQRYKECLSLSVDDLPVLDGESPIQVYQQFCESFKFTFLPLIGSTVTGISMSLGPDGELRYPSHQQLARSRTGVGEFQCYDENILALLKHYADATGKPLWGLGGPHDAPKYDQSPNSTNFFKDNGGSWDSPYGDFFLSWYSNQLIDHGDRLLHMASTMFRDTEVTISGKVPLNHSWYKTNSHPSELTAGFYNTVSRDGYDAVAEMFAKNSCKMILPGLDLSDKNEPHYTNSSPELLLSQIKTACRKHGVQVSGQNSSVSGAPGGFEQIKKNLSGSDCVVDLFTYHRMGAYFFSPEHFPKFTEFVRSFNQPELHSDDLQSEVTETTSKSSIHMQAA